MEKKMKTHVDWLHLTKFRHDNFAMESNALKR